MNKKLYKLMDWAAIEAIEYAEEDQPQKILGAHVVGNAMLYQTFLPGAVKVDVVLDDEDKTTAMGMVDEEGFFAAVMNHKTQKNYHYVVTDEEGKSHVYRDPYQYEVSLTEDEITKINSGLHYQVYEVMGAHFTKMDGQEGVMFRVWAPNAVRVSVVGDFNAWNGKIHPMIRHEETGIFMLFIPALAEGMNYKYEIQMRGGLTHLKADPYAVRSQMAPDTASVLCREDAFAWNDDEWMAKRAEFDTKKAPLSIYEINLHTYKEENGKNMSLSEIAKEVIPYVKKNGYTHIELMPIMEYMDEYFNGYQTTGYYSVSARYGTNEEMKAFIDSFHVAGIGVILDWVPSFFARDEHGLSNFDGTFLYGHLDERQRENVAYDAYNFNYGRPQVSNFLIANGIYWVEKFHVDGLRLSGLSSMLYMDYGKSEGQWVPNIYGGSENLEGVEFIKHFNSILHKMYPGVLTIAKETSAWPKITESLERDGLGFDYAWNIGFMQDFIAYMKKPYEERMNSLKDLTFSMVYAYSENYILPISHNEVYRNGGSLLDCMQMEEEWKKPFLRALYSFFMLHPGKKLTYMDQEIDETIQVLNRMYKELPALSALDIEADGFEWINCLDHGDGTLSFVRKNGNLENNLLVVANFSQNDYEEYKLGVSEEGKYTEIYNSNMKEAGGNAKLDTEVKATKEEYYDGRNYSFSIKMAPMSVSVYSYRPFTKEELLEIAERKVAEIRAQLEKEALEKAKALEKMSLKDSLESKVHEARENILSGAEAETEVKVVRKKAAVKKNDEKSVAKEPVKKAAQKKTVAKAKAETKTKAEAENKAAAQKAEAKTDSRENKSVKAKK